MSRTRTNTTKCSKKALSCWTWTRRSRKATSTSWRGSTICLSRSLSITRWSTCSSAMSMKASTLSSRWRLYCPKRRANGWSWRLCTTMVQCWCCLIAWFHRLLVSVLLRATFGTAILGALTRLTARLWPSLSSLQAIFIIRQLEKKLFRTSTPPSISQGLGLTASWWSRC